MTSFRPEGMQLGSNGRTIIIPGWLMAAVIISTSIFIFGFRVGSQINDILTTARFTEYRICRIESSLRLERWPTCTGLQLDSLSR